MVTKEQKLQPSPQPEPAAAPQTVARPPPAVTTRPTAAAQPAAVPRPVLTAPVIGDQLTRQLDRLPRLFPASDHDTQSLLEKTTASVEARQFGEAGLHLRRLLENRNLTAEQRRALLELTATVYQEIAAESRANQPPPVPRPATDPADELR